MSENQTKFFSPETVNALVESALKPWTFKTDDEAREVIEHDDMNGNWATDWRQVDSLPCEIGLDGHFTRRQLLALIHFHPDNKETQNGV